MKWTVHGRRTLYESDWVNLSLEDVELAEGRRLEHHVIRMPRQSVAVVVRDDADRVLLLWRHRFITDTWGWEIPAGWADPGESAEDAARREVGEETGWSPGPLTELARYFAVPGIATFALPSTRPTAPPTRVSHRTHRSRLGSSGCLSPTCAS
jgi:8-oxo-dGTP pyrophosphatase MutT (NUDIX family)